MKFEYFILSPLLCISAKESCLGRCGQYYDSQLPCQCNTACNTHRDCCKDYDDSCPKEFCVGRCDQPYDKRHQCQCNTACTQYNNCCDDYDAFCLLGVNNATGTEESSSGMIAGVTVSLTVVMLILVVILVLVYRKIRLRKQLVSRPVGNGKRTSKMNYYATEDVQEDQYHDIDISNGDYCLAAAVSDNTVNIDRAEDGEATYVRAISGVYDKLNEKDRKIPTKNQNENASKLEGSKMEIYTLTSNLTVNQQTMSKNSKSIDKWQATDAVNFDPTYNHSDNIILREELSNYDHFSIKT
ncbi:ENDOU [Mytilus coruscus]|uniref:ENDOU n=1 Tax=Mytilus coruscus TaxID=42192 RepID=A0A6J8E103_MYTCO|nr:ENDOU [Mytilus coruscus]